MDCDSDGIKEVIIEGGGMGQGYLFTSYTLLSLKNDKETVLYKNEAEDGSAGAYVMNKKVGEEVSKKIDVVYVDKDKDGKAELIETTTIGVFQSYTEKGGVKEKYTKQKSTYYLVNGKYLKK